MVQAGHDKCIVRRLVNPYCKRVAVSCPGGARFGNLAGTWSLKGPDVPSPDGWSGPAVIHRRTQNTGGAFSAAAWLARNLSITD